MFVFSRWPGLPSMLLRALRVVNLELGRRFYKLHPPHDADRAGVGHRRDEKQAFHFDGFGSASYYASCGLAILILQLLLFTSTGGGVYVWSASVGHTGAVARMRSASRRIVQHLRLPLSESFGGYHPRKSVAESKSTAEFNVDDCQLGFSPCGSFCSISLQASSPVPSFYLKPAAQYVNASASQGSFSVAAFGTSERDVLFSVFLGYFAACLSLRFIPGCLCWTRVHHLRC
jgi:hypothetical protein